MSHAKPEIIESSLSPKSCFVQFRVTPEEHEEIKVLAKQRAESTSDFARAATLKRVDVARAIDTATRGDIEQVQQSLLALRKELNELRTSTAVVVELVDLVKSTRRLAAASMASLAHLRIQANQSTLESQAAVKQHIDFAEASADMLLTYFASRKQ